MATLTCSHDKGGSTSSAYMMSQDEGRVSKCFRCAVVHRPLVLWSLAIGLAMGSLQTMINQGNVIFSGEESLQLAWKVPLTFLVPCCVAATGALLNARYRRKS